jgi:tetratricopeptide (TPR) repeat protein
MYLRRFPHSFLTFAETDHSVMRQLCLRTLLLASGAALCSGCSILESKEQKSYETIEANERYDTETARKEHEKALKLLDKSQHGKPAKLAEAEVHLQKALVADITYGPVHNSLGIVYMRQRKYYTAAWEFEYAAKLMPDNFEPLYNLGLLYETADKLENAIAYYEQAIALAPRNPVVIGNLAKAKLRDGRDFEEVRPLLQDACLP